MPDRLHTYFVLLISLLLIFSCVEPPLDEVPPGMGRIFGIEENSTVRESSVTLQWEGANHLVNQFSYKYTPGHEDWSAWSVEKTAKLEYLDEGNYTFEVRGRYREGKEGEAESRSFTVDIPGPGLLLKPLRTEIIADETDKHFEMELIANDVENLVLAHIILKFEPDRTQVSAVDPGGVFQKIPAFFESIDNDSGIIDISMSTIGAEPSIINGTETIAIVTFSRHSLGGSRIYFEAGSELHDLDGFQIYRVEQRFTGSYIEISPSKKGQPVSKQHLLESRTAYVDSLDWR